MKPAPGAASKLAMSIHKVNIDAIALGASAFLLDWPGEPRPPTIPARAHQVLWTDDYWRGAEMAREVVDAAVGGWKRMKTEGISDPAKAQRVGAALDVAGRATIHVVVARMTHGIVLESEEADLDLADVIEAALRGIVETGDPEHRTEAPRSCDDEVAADAWAEA